MNTNEKLSGVFAPIATPFKPDEDVDKNALKNNLTFYNKTGLRGYLVLGSNGENKSLTESEKREVLETVSAGKGETKTVIVGVMVEAQRQAEEFVRIAADLEVDFVLLQSPSYFKKLMNDETLYRYFSTAADYSPVPVLIYNAPGFNGIDLSLYLIHRLSEHPNIVGMKDSTPGKDTEIMQLNSDHFHVLAGSINKLMVFMKLGSIGGTVSLANYCPNLAVQLLQCLLEKSAETCESLNERLVFMNKRIAGQFGVPGVKAAMNQLGLKAGIPRRPLYALTEQHIRTIQTVLEEAGALPI